jgi:hypothetical protein
MSKNLLASFRPLCSTARGREVVREHGLPPYIDGSCRREPDLEHSRPGISALCRASRFAPRLDEGDRVAFITVAGTYDEDRLTCWKLVALLRVTQRFASHAEAAAWYRKEGHPLPSNCMVRGNGPKPMELTLGPRGAKGCSQRELKAWDELYSDRAKAHPVFLVCERLWVELDHPVRIERADWERRYGRVPATQTPPAIPDTLWTWLESRTRRKAA